MFSGEPDNGGTFARLSLDNSRCSVGSEETDSGENNVLKHLEKRLFNMFALSMSLSAYTPSAFSDGIVGDSFLMSFVNVFDVCLYLPPCFVPLLYLWLR